MAQKVSVQFIDDLDPDVTQDVETVTFALNGKNYEIDLGAENRDALYAFMDKYVDAARRGTSATSSSSPSRSRSSSSGETAKIREWATANDVPVNARGRIPASVREQYLAAQH